MTVLKKFCRKYPAAVNHFSPPKSYFTGGFEAPLSFIPENVICWVAVNESCEVASQMHSRFCLSIALKNPTVKYVEGIPFRLKEDEAILIFPTQIHYKKNDPGILEQTMLYFVFSLPPEADLKALEPLRNRVCRLDDRARGLLVKMMAIVYTKDKDNYPLFPLFLAHLLILMLSGRKTSGESFFEGGSRTFQNAVGYIRQHYQSPDICLKTVADAIGISPSRLTTVFREQSLGISVGRYIANLKFYRSMELLSTTDMTIGEIARFCGYGNSFSFARRFKQLHPEHISPSRYRFLVTRAEIRSPGR